MPPYQGGGDMIRSVTFAKTAYNELPYKFEAGTPNIAGAIGLARRSITWSALGIAALPPMNRRCWRTATEAGDTPACGSSAPRGTRPASCRSSLDGVHPHDIGTILDQDGIAIRAGHHCAMPIMQRFGIAGTARASFAFYNTRAEVDALVQGWQGTGDVSADE